MCTFRLSAISGLRLVLLIAMVGFVLVACGPAARTDQTGAEVRAGGATGGWADNIRSAMPTSGANGTQPQRVDTSAEAMTTTTAIAAESTAAAAATRPIGPDGRPAAGQCRADGSWAIKDAPSDAATPVDCIEPHGLETWRVTEIPAPWNIASARRPVDDSAGPASGTHADLVVAVSKACADEDGESYLGLPREAATVGQRRAVTPFRFFWFIPTQEQWDQGARWLRCDVGLSWSDTNATVRGSLQSAASKPEFAGILSACELDNEYVPCAYPHALEWVSDYEVPVGDRPDPASHPAAYNQWLDLCRQDVRDFRPGPRSQFFLWVSPSSQEQWNLGHRYVRCVIGFGADVDHLIQTAGTARDRLQAT